MSQSFLTADLYDSFGDSCSSCDIQFRQYGGRRVFSGRIRTVKCMDDNALLRRTLDTGSNGEVLIVDGSGFLGSALLGDMIAGLGAKNGWSGVVMLAAIRDACALADIDFGVKALGTNPKRSSKNGTGAMDIPVSFGGVTFTPGHWIYSDDDGILVSAKNLTKS